MYGRFWETEGMVKPPSLKLDLKGKRSICPLCNRLWGSLNHSFLKVTGKKKSVIYKQKEKAKLGICFHQEVSIFKKSPLKPPVSCNLENQVQGIGSPERWFGLKVILLLLLQWNWRMPRNTNLLSLGTYWRGYLLWILIAHHVQGKKANGSHSSWQSGMGNRYIQRAAVMVQCDALLKACTGYAVWIQNRGKKNRTKQT